MSQWQNKLDELENLPSDNFNKEIAWDKLHKRLNKNSIQKRAIWYWIAASFFIVIASSLLLRNSNRHKVLNKNILVQAGNKNGIRFLLRDNKKENGNNGFVKINNTISNYKSRKKDKIILSKSVGNIRLIATVSSMLHEQRTIQSLQPIDTFSSVAITVPERKKLKVVHINEIGESVEESSMVHNIESHSFQIKIANQEVYVNTTIASKEKGFIIKTKSASN